MHRAQQTKRGNEQARAVVVAGGAPPHAPASSVGEKPHTPPFTHCYSVYVTRCALRHFEHDVEREFEKKEDALSYYNGLFMALYQANGFFGCVLSSVLLQCYPWNCTATADTATTHRLFVIMGCLCVVGVFVISFVPGVDAAGGFDGASASFALDQEEQSFLGSAGSGGKYGSNDDDSDSDTDARGQDQGQSKLLDDGGDEDVTVWSVIQLCLSDSRMALLVPVCFFNGMGLAWVFGEYTGNVVRPVLSTAFSGYVVAAFYLVNAVATMAGGTLASVPWIGRKGESFGTGVAAEAAPPPPPPLSRAALPYSLLSAVVAALFRHRCQSFSPPTPRQASSSPPLSSKSLSLRVSVSPSACRRTMLIRGTIAGW